MNPRALRERQKADTRACILGAARKAFEEEGFENATIRAIASRAGIGTGTIHSHFRDKSALLVATVLDDLHEVHEDSWRTIPKDAPLIDRLLHLAAKGYAYWGNRPSISRALLREMYFTPGPARDQLHALDREAMKVHVRYLEDARRRGELRKDTDTDVLSRVTFSFYLTTILMNLNHLALQPGHDGDNSDSRLHICRMIDQTRKFLELLFDGVGPGYNSNNR